MQAKLRSAARFAAAMLVAVIVAGCQTAGFGRAGPEGAEARAERLTREGEHAAAARAFELAARNATEADRNRLWLAAAEAWIRAQDLGSTEVAIGMLAPPIAEADTRERLRLDVELALARGDNAGAAALLRGLPSGEDEATLATRARVQFGALQVADAVTTLIARESLLADPADRLGNQREIVDGIAGALERGGDARAPAGADALLAGWLELGRILADARAGALGSQRRLQTWRERYPAHPASDALWRGLIERPGVAGDLPRQVALLLPLSGRAEAAGRAVRDGFLAAYYDHGSATRPRLRIYDVAARDASTSYLQALADGSDFVVGPLTREEVAALALLADGRATTLALNFLPDGAQVPARFFQYALSPEDEARLAARRAAADGRLSGVILGPQSDWGRRVQAAFAEEFTALGGTVAEQADYPTATVDFNDLLRNLLRTTGQRGSTARPDAQFIFVAAQPVHGRLIRTQLRFNYASGLPVYATSDVFDAAGTSNVDLDGVLFPDMPWVLDPYGPAAAARDAAERLWPRRPGQIGRLHAFGYDAFRLIGELRRLQAGGTSPLPGLTGRLSVDSAGRVRRELDWAQVVDGRPVSPPPPPPVVGAPST